jgi:hypothetical protein
MQADPYVSYSITYAGWLSVDCVFGGCYGVQSLAKPASPSSEAALEVCAASRPGLSAPLALPHNTT